jgi:hypothetical protein
MRYIQNSSPLFLLKANQFRALPEKSRKTFMVGAVKKGK